MKFITRLFPLLISVLFLAVCIAPTRGQSGSSTVYQLNPDGLAQISASPGARTLVPTYAATSTLNPNAGIVHQLKGDSAVSATSTWNAPSGGTFGQMLVTIVTASGAGTITVTFGTNFLPTATAAPTTGKSITVIWFSDGTSWHEAARSASAQ